MTTQNNHADRPSQVDGEPGVFDRFATRVSGFVAKAWFFAGCLLMVLIWAPSIFVIRDVDTWQLIINTATTIVTYLLVALLQNTQSRADKAIQHKLNAIAAGLADLMDATETSDDTLDHDTTELRAAVGLEHRETS